MRSRLRHLSFRSTAERKAMAGYPRRLMSCGSSGGLGKWVVACPKKTNYQHEGAGMPTMKRCPSQAQVTKTRS